MSISIIAVGKMKEKPYRQMADEYLKRLSRYGKVDEIELPDLPEPVNSSPAIEAQIKDKEGEAILSRIRPSDYVIALTIPGKQWDSPGLSRHLDDLMTRVPVWKLQCNMDPEAARVAYAAMSGAIGCE